MKKDIATDFQSGMILGQLLATTKAAIRSIGAESGGKLPEPVITQWLGKSLLTQNGIGIYDSGSGLKVENDIHKRKSSKLWGTFTQAEIDKVLDMGEMGFAVNTIARQFGYSWSQVRRILDGAKPGQEKKQPMSAATKAKISEAQKKRWKERESPSTS